MSDREFLIRVSYMEIYNEEINDLFAVENQKLQIHESLEVGVETFFDNLRVLVYFSIYFFLFPLQSGVFVAGLREEIVNNAEQVLQLIESGEGLKAQSNYDWLFIC